MKKIEKVTLIEVSNERMKFLEMKEGHLKLSEKFEFHFDDKLVSSSVISEIVHFTDSLFKIKTKNSYYIFKQIGN